MKYIIEIERSAVATLVIEADSLDQAESKAFVQVRDEDFGHGNLYLVEVDEVTTSDRMRRRERKRLRQLPKPLPDPEQQRANTSGLIRRLLGFWLFHKIFGGNS